MALRLITCSPRRTALLPPLRPEKQLPPGALTPAPRRQDHTSLPYALMPFATGTASVHRDPPLDRGDHDAPLLPGRDGCYVALIWGSVKQKYFRFRQIFRLTRLPTIGIDDLPVGSVCRGSISTSSLRAKRLVTSTFGSMADMTGLVAGSAGRDDPKGDIGSSLRV